MIPAIPRYLLPHKAVLKKAVSADSWGKSEYKCTPLFRVRITPCRGQRFALSGDMPELSAVMLFDTENSLPLPAPEFDTGDIVAFGNREFVVRKVGTFYADSDNIHHLEVELA